MRTLEIYADYLEGDDWLGGKIAAANIAELRTNRWPPEVVTTDGRIGFVTAARRRDLEMFGEQHGIPTVWRDDVWSLIAEEFLDTEFDETQREATLARLEANGFSREEVAAIRHFIRIPMLAQTALSWEWVHYGLRDVLLSRPVRILPNRWVQGAEYRPRNGSASELRRWAEGIANRAPVRSSAASVPVLDDAEVLLRLEHRFLSPRVGTVRGSAPFDGWENRRQRLREVQLHLLESWSAPHRHYHGPRHLLAVLDAVQSFQPERAFVLAAWFHDVVYDPTRSDNEAESARWMERLTAPLVQDGTVDGADLDLALRMVLATASPLEPLLNDSGGAAIARFLDADFQIFASLPAEYDRYLAEVRQEYAFVPDEAFRLGRRAFLEKLDAAVEKRGFFFREASPFAEGLALENLRRERESLA